MRVFLVLLEVTPQLPPVEHVNTHGGQIVFRDGGLFVKLIDSAVLVRIQNAEPAGLHERHLDHRDCTGRLMLLVERNHLGVVHLIDMVARKHQHILRVIALDKRDVLVDGVGRPLIPIPALAALVRRQHMDTGIDPVQIPRLPRTDVFVQLERLILRQHPHRLNAGIDAVGQRKIDDAVLPPVGHRRLGDALRQRIQPAPLPSCEQHGHAFLLAKHTDSSLSDILAGGPPGFFMHPPASGVSVRRGAPETPQTAAAASAPRTAQARASARAPPPPSRCGSPCRRIRRHRW